MHLNTARWIDAVLKLAKNDYFIFCILAYLMSTWFLQTQVDRCIHHQYKYLHFGMVADNSSLKIDNKITISEILNYSDVHRLWISIYIQQKHRWRIRFCSVPRYAGTVIMSFDHVIISTPGNWFQTNTLEHESDDRTGNTVSSVCVTNGKDTALEWQIWPTYVTVLCFRKNHDSRYRAGILILVRVLWVTISKFTDNFGSFFKYTFQNSSNFYPTEIMWRKMAHSVCLKPASMEAWCLHTLWCYTVPAKMKQYNG